MAYAPCFPLRTKGDDGGFPHIRIAVPLLRIHGIALQRISTNKPPAPIILPNAHPDSASRTVLLPLPLAGVAIHEIVGANGISKGIITVGASDDSAGIGQRRSITMRVVEIIRSDW